MKKHKFNLARKNLFGIIKSFLIKLIIIIIAVFLIVLFVINNLNEFLRTSDYFKTQEVIFNEENNVDLSYLEGQNIFTIDLQEESRHITEHYPIYRKARFFRVLPNRMFVEFVRRKPVAVIKLYRNFYVDEGAVLFATTEQAEQLEEQSLPVILGVEAKISDPKIGKEYNIRQLTVALNILKELSSNSALKDCKVKKIDVTNLSNISSFIFIQLLPEDYSKKQTAKAIKELEIRLDTYNIHDKVNILAGLFVQVRGELANIRYIDLRFKEPVIKFNEDKS